MKSITVALLASLAIGKKCPDQKSIQQYAPEEFNIDQFMGKNPYYEIAYHDHTQPEICGCQVSRKSLETSTKMLDDSQIQCPYDSSDPYFGHIYKQPLYYNLTDEPGIYQGDWFVTPNVAYPDTVVAFGKPESDGDEYPWALEFQCVEQHGRTAFAAVNFLSRANTGAVMEKNYAEMLEAAAQSGIDQYWDKLIIVDHSNCVYERSDAMEAQFLV